MSAYNIQAIKEKIERLQNGGRAPRKKTEDTGPKLPFWKPVLPEGERTAKYEIRFLPYNSPTGQPFHEVAQYSNKRLLGPNGWRSVAPFQYDLEDPIRDTLVALSSEHQPIEVFKAMNCLRPQNSYYAPIIVRGEEDKGVQVWELSEKRALDVYSILAHEDFEDENLFDPMTGRDFTVTVTLTDKTFTAPNGKIYPVSDVNIKERKKPSKLAPTKGAAEEIIEQIPDFDAYFKSRVRDTDYYRKLLSNLFPEGANSASEEGTAHETAMAKKFAVLDTSSEEDDNDDGGLDEDAVNKIDAAFDDLF